MKKLRSVFIFLITVLLLAGSTLPACAAAVVNSFEFEKIGEKTASPTGSEGEYEVRVDVPGRFETTGYNELIIMVDASTSQSGNFPILKQMLLGLAKELVAEDSSIHITLMGFGVGPKHAGTFSSYASLAAFLETATQEDLLQERSATNCEVGFEFVREYIEGSDKLKNAIVLFTSDGEANLDETPRDWSKWADPDVFATLWEIPGLTQYFIGVEVGHIMGGYEPISATAEMFPDEAAAVAAAMTEYGIQSDEHIEAAMALYDAMMANADAYITKVLQHVFAYSGLNWSEKQTAADVERAFQAYFRAYPGTADANAYESYMNLYYIILGNTGKRFSPDKYTRAAAASAQLMANEKVVSLYHVGYSSATNNWMNPEKGYFSAYDSSKLKYFYNSEFAGVAENIGDLAYELITTGYFDVTVTDPMSKWVILDEESIKIYNNSTGELLWQYGQGWLTDVHLTEGEPISVSVNADGQPEITWRVKDGYLLTADRYSMRYIVNIDEHAPGFQPGIEYPLNDPTSVAYTDAEGQPHTNPLDVPDGKEGEPYNTGYFPINDDYHAIIINNEFIPSEHIYYEDICIICNHELEHEEAPEIAPDEEIVEEDTEEIVEEVEAPVEAEAEEAEDITEEATPKTGLMLAVPPLAIVGIAIILTKKR